MVARCRIRRVPTIVSGAQEGSYAGSSHAHLNFANLAVPEDIRASLAHVRTCTPESREVKGVVDRRAVVVISLACTTAICGAGVAQGQRQHAVTRTPSPLTLNAAPTPHLPVQRYDTSGSIPQVTGTSIDLRHVNAALREAVLRDQRAYAPSARIDAKIAGGPSACRGVYRVQTDRRLLSASTVVTSVMLPALELGWLAAVEDWPSPRGIAATHWRASSIC